LNDLLNAEESTRLLAADFLPEKNYTLQLLEESTEMSKKQVRMAQWAYAPTISVFHQYSTRKYFSDERTMNMTPPNLLGISLSVPIFSSGSRYSAVQSAKRTYEKQLNTLADTQDAMEIQHRQLCYNLVSAQEDFQNQAQNVEVTQRVFDNIAKKYDYGHASSMDLTTSSTNLITAQSNYVKSLLEYVKATIELEKLLNL
jgi:outer membrane protein TolC